MQEDTSKTKQQKEHEVYGRELNQMIRVHLVYLIFKISKEKVTSYEWKDQNAKQLAEMVLRMFAQKQLSLSH